MWGGDAARFSTAEDGWWWFFGAGELPVISHILGCVSPTVLRVGGYRFYFFSREEPRAHVHVQHPTGEAKFRLEPRLELARNYGLTASRINTALQAIRAHEDEIRAAWKKHFGR
jgi:hypothetical protein